MVRANVIWSNYIGMNGAVINDGRIKVRLNVVGTNVSRTIFC